MSTLNLHTEADVELRTGNFNALFHTAASPAVWQGAASKR